MNLRELSSKLGLSQTTVSRALNGFPEVSEETRARVREAAEKYGYRPSAAARRLATGQSGTLGLIFPAERNMLGDLLFTEFLGGCVERASLLSYDITLGMAHGSQSEEAVYRRAVRNARVDAMILSSPVIADPRPHLLRQLGMPFIVHGRTRTECLMRLRRALSEYVIGGINTTIPLFQELLEEPDIANGDYDIHWLEHYFEKRKASQA